MIAEVNLVLKKFIPDYYFKSVFDIPYEELYKDGVRLILTDLDNTLISYNETMPNDKLFELKKKIEDMGFEFIIVSNSRKNRVDNFSKAYDIKYHKFSTKPLKRGIKKTIKILTKRKYNNNEIILLGDQLMTDVLGGKRCGIRVALIEPIDKDSDIKATRLNRSMERFFIKRVKRKYPELYNERLKDFGGDL